MSNREFNDPYLYPGTTVLINRFNIRDADELTEIEAFIFQTNQTLPLPEGKLDYDHLKAIHKHFFGEVYPWAGEQRTLDIAKGGSYFGHCAYLAKELDKLFLQLKKENYLIGTSHNEFYESLSFYFNEINAAHPFREGNGRTQRAFCDLIAEKAGYKLNWQAVHEETYLQASIAGFQQGDYQPMAEVFQQIATPLKRDHSIQLVEKDLSDAASQQLYDYVEKQLQLTELIKQKNRYLITDNALSQTYAQQAKTLNEELKRIGQAMLKDPTTEQFLKQPYLVSLNKQGGFAAIYARLKSHCDDQKDRLAVLRYAEGSSRTHNQTQGHSQKLSNQTKK